MNTDRVTFFFYGTLMDAAICARVTGVAVTAARLRPATLDDYKVVRVADQHYPALVPSSGSQVQGRLLRNVGPEAQRRLAIYEDETYEPKWVKVRGVGGIKAMALAFVAGPRMRLTDEHWDFDDWCRRHRRPFLMGLDRWISTSEKVGKAADVLR
jgi:gamma-glutamylcyclotransferase (GGCT)/AIG2-like uncharacterized protein YtfP